MKNMRPLDWQKIDNFGLFQRLVNDLFALEINHPGFLSSSPEIGKDGGWDGRFDGEYMGRKGVWSFQSKWTKHNLTSAYKQLHAELEKELKKAKKNKVEYLLFATNAHLRVGIDDHVGNLEKLNENEKYVKKLFIWPRENLERTITKHHLLRHNYFGDPQEPMFVPAQIYSESEPPLVDKIIKREEAFATIQDFLSNSELNIFIVHAGGGFGKTQFVISASNQLSLIRPDLGVWFCRPGIRDVNEAINELDHQKDLVIFLDDAERYLEETKKLIAHTKTFSPGKLKLVLSCRSAGKNIIKNLANFLRIEAITEFELHPLTEAEQIEILISAAAPKIVKHPERIVKGLNGNLFLIATTGKLMKGGDVDPIHIKQKIKTSIEQETVTALNGLMNEYTSKKLLRELTVIVPFSKDLRSGTRERLASILKLDLELLNEAIGRLIDARILRLLGASIRFNPDMMGDIYLSVELDRGDSVEVVNRFFESWLNDYPKQLTINLAAAMRHSETDASRQAVKALIKKWVSEASNTPGSDKLKRINQIVPIAFLSPEDIIALILAYIDSPDDGGLDRDDYGPAISQILHVAGFENHLIKLIFYIAQKDLKGMYDNYTPSRLIRQMTSPIEVTIKSAVATLIILSELVSNPDCAEAEAKLAAEGCKEALSGSHEYSESYGIQFTVGRKTLTYEKPFKTGVDELRDKGMELLKRLISHPNVKISKIGIEIVNDIGDEAQSTDNDLWQRILADKTQALTWLKQTITATSSFEILSSIEDVLIRYWANNNIYGKLSDLCGEMLINYPRSDEYIIFRYFVAHDLIIRDFSIINNNAPSEGRWSWLVYKHFRLHELKQEELDVVVEALARKYQEGNAVLGYLDKLDEDVKGITQWQYIPLVETWSKFDNQIFVQIADDVSLFSRVPTMFLKGVYRVISDHNKKYIDEYAKKLLDQSNKIDAQGADILLDLIARHSVPSAEFLPWLFEIIERGDSYTKHLILHRVYFIFKDRDKGEKTRAIELLEFVMSKPIDDRVLDMVDFLLPHVIQWESPKDKVDNIRVKLYEVISNMPSIGYHADELLKFVVAGDLNKFLDLIYYRLKKSQETPIIEDGVRFDPIPSDGFRSGIDLVKSYEGFAKMMDQINFWKSQDLLYSFDIENLLKHLNNGDTKHEDFLPRYINEKIDSGNIEDIRIAITSLFGVPFSSDTADLFLNLLLTAEKVGILDEARDVFSHQVISGSYSGTVGEAPPALVNKLNALMRIHATCSSSMIKDVLGTHIKSMNEDIKRHVDEGEELMSPK